MSTVNLNEMMVYSGVQFGTSGVRGLVKDMTDKICFTYVSAFLQYLIEQQLIQQGDKVGLAGDLRTSSPRIMNATSAACINMGFEPINYGHIPSPAIALYGIAYSMSTIMITGSHIPDDRNGIKFNTIHGEILKQDEQGIRSQSVVINDSLFTNDGCLLSQGHLRQAINNAEQYYISRFIDFLPPKCLVGKRIGLYEHSSVSRDCLMTIFQQLGATVTPLGRSEEFISVDTEAIRPEDVIHAKQWMRKYDFDCIVSTDGDGDRPLISDEKGNWLRGDIAGVLCAQYLNSECVVTPISSNSVVEKSKLFDKVIRTRIGSPYVIEAMQEMAIGLDKTVVAYEANGGFLQQTPIRKNNKTLAPLPTRDATIVPLAVILLAQQQNATISQLLNSLPQRYTFSDRIKGFPSELSTNIINSMLAADRKSNLKVIKSHFDSFGEPVAIDNTDGIRITFDSESIVHIRPSGNAPELRCYTEASSEYEAESINKKCMKIMAAWL